MPWDALFGDPSRVFWHQLLYVHMHVINAFGVLGWLALVVAVPQVVFMLLLVAIWTPTPPHWALPAVAFRYSRWCGCCTPMILP